MFRSFSVCTVMAWDDLAGTVRPDVPKPAGSLVSLSWCLFCFFRQHKLRGLSICLKVMVHSAGKFTLR